MACVMIHKSLFAVAASDIERFDIRTIRDHGIATGKKTGETNGRIAAGVTAITIEDIAINPFRQRTAATV
jgi:hypothetical protein